MSADVARRGADRVGNRLLDGLPAPDKDRLLARLTPVFLNIKTVLFEPGQLVDAVYFPLDGVVSLVTPLEDGAIVEVATVGNEGLVGVPLVLGGSLAVRAISQVAGRCLTMEAGVFLAELAKGGRWPDWCSATCRPCSGRSHRPPPATGSIRTRSG